MERILTCNCVFSFMPPITMHCSVLCPLSLCIGGMVSLSFTCVYVLLQFSFHSQTLVPLKKIIWNLYTVRDWSLFPFQNNLRWKQEHPCPMDTIETLFHFWFAILHIYRQEDTCLWFSDNFWKNNTCIFTLV
jgi:hypothetical protein